MSDVPMPTKCRVVLFYPCDYTTGKLMDPLPMTVTHVHALSSEIDGVVMDGASDDRPVYSVRGVAHISYPLSARNSEWTPRWDWPPRV